MTAWLLAALLANTTVAPSEISPISAGEGAPYVSGFSAQNLGGGNWRFTGSVSDPDEDPTGFTVYFYGVIAGRSTTVRSDDTFSLTVDLGSAYGAAGAQSRDSDGNKSNIAVTQVH